MGNVLKMALPYINDINDKFVNCNDTSFIKARQQFASPDYEDPVFSSSHEELHNGLKRDWGSDWVCCDSSK